MCFTEMTNDITPTSWFYNRFIHSQNETDSNLHSRLEIVRPLESCASISGTNKPTYTKIIQMFNVCNHDQHDTSKTLTIANYSEDPIEQYIFVTCISSIETKSRQLMIASAVVDI